MRQKAGRRHLLEHKATKRTRRLDGRTAVAASDTKRERDAERLIAAPLNVLNSRIGNTPMARVKRALNAQKKRRTVLKGVQGLSRPAVPAVSQSQRQQLHSLTYAYRDRRARKGEFRKLWISPDQRGGPRQRHHLQPVDPGSKAAGVEVDRKNLPTSPSPTLRHSPRSGRGGQGSLAGGRQRSAGDAA